MAKLGEANIGGRMVPAWLLDLTAEELDNLKWYSERYSNPNLLDNPWFTVNQRGVTSYISNDSYGVDRWRCLYADTISINSNNEITINGTLGHTATFEQPVDRSLLNLVGKQVTFSFLTTRGDVKLASFTVRDSTENYYCVDNESKEYVCIDTRENREVCSVQIIGKVVTIKAIKLELGNVSTLANDIPPDYTTELLKCMTSKADFADTYANRSVAPKMVDSEYDQNWPLECYNGNFITRKMYRGFDVWSPSPVASDSVTELASWGRSYAIDVEAGQTVNYPLVSNHTYLISVSDNVRGGVCLIQTAGSSISSITKLVPMGSWSVSIGTGLTINVTEIDGRYAMRAFITML